MDLKGLERIATENGCGFLLRGNSPNVVLIGYDHGFQGFPNNKQESKIISLIDFLKPKFVLDENMQHYEYNPRTDELKSLPDVTSGIIFPDSVSIHECQISHNLLGLSKKLGYQMIGHDLSVDEMALVFEENYGIKITKKNITEITRKNPYEDAADWRFDDCLNLPRNKRMAERIISYLAMSTQPLISVTGNAHILPLGTYKARWEIELMGLELASEFQGSELTSELERKGVNYVSIDIDNSLVRK